MMNEKKPKEIERDLAAHRIVRAVESKRQLAEVLLDFWFNHFNVYGDKGQDKWLIISYERDALRPHLFGHFRELLDATAKHPAMLYYLDNWLSVAPNGPRDASPTRSPPNAPAVSTRTMRASCSSCIRSASTAATRKTTCAKPRELSPVVNPAPQRRGRVRLSSQKHARIPKSVLGHTVERAAGGRRARARSGRRAPCDRSLHRHQALPKVRRRRSSARSGDQDRRGVLRNARRSFSGLRGHLRLARVLVRRCLRFEDQDTARALRIGPASAGRNRHQRSGAPAAAHAHGRASLPGPASDWVSRGSRRVGELRARSSHGSTSVSLSHLVE